MLCKWSLLFNEMHAIDSTNVNNSCTHYGLCLSEYVHNVINITSDPIKEPGQGEEEQLKYFLSDKSAQQQEVTHN